MKAKSATYHLVDLSPAHREMPHFLDLFWWRHIIYGLLEIDVTTARRFIQDHKERTGELLSFTGYLAFCLAQAIDEDKSVQGLFRGNRQLVVFDDVDVALPIERKVDGARVPTSHIIRAANHKTFLEIHSEIRRVQAQAVPPSKGFAPWLRSGMLLPGPLSKLFVAFVRAANRLDPTITARVAGTVGVVCALGVPHVLARRFGGVTGDVMGASVILTETLLLVAVGASLIKPAITGTVQKTSGALATLGFAIFYMIINIGSFFGRGTAYVVRTRPDVVLVLGTVAVCGVAAALLTLLVRWNVAHREQPGTIAKTTLGALAIISGAGLGISRALKLRPAPELAAGSGALSYIFAVATVASIVAFFVVLVFYKEPAVAADAPAKPKRSPGRILLDMVLVLKNPRFTLFLVVISGFFFLYNQVYNVMPLYVKRVVETSPAMDLYTAANPFVIVCFQLLVTSFFGKMKPVKSMIVGCVIIGVSMGINLWPLWSAGGLRAPVADLLPIASIFIILTVGLIAFGELYTSPRMYEYIGALAPKGQEGLFLGYANLPLAIGSLTGGPVGAWIFNDVMAKGATTRPDGLLELDRAAATRGWLLLMAIGFLSAVAMWAFNRWVEKQERTETPSPA